MNAKQYFKHARTLGAFPAHECLAIARQAAELDEKGRANKIAPPAFMSREVLHNYSNPITLSFAIKVF